MSKAHDQGELFLDGEGDRWFSRNATSISSAEHTRRDLPLRMLALAPSFKPRRILEIGCSTGWRLAALRERYGCAVTGVEPSADAIEEGKRLHGADFDLRRGLSRELPIDGSETFDLIVCAYMLHWVARDALLRTVAEIDRVLENNGHLVINDFFPDFPQRRKYHHLDDGLAFTFKQDLAQLFLGTNVYRHIGRTTADHQPKTDDFLTMTRVESGDRVVCDLLQKDLSMHFDAG